MDEHTEDLIRDILETDLSGSVDNLEDLVDIDMDEVNDRSGTDATNILECISDLYTNEDFMNRNPKLRRRLETDLESIRILIKMRRSDEITHDLLIKAISAKPSNASLYRALTEVQKTIISITSRIDETLKNLSALIKNYQTELCFEAEPDPESGTEPESTVSRGTKDFIIQMMAESGAEEPGTEQE